MSSQVVRGFIKDGVLDTIILGDLIPFQLSVAVKLLKKIHLNILKFNFTSKNRSHDRGSLKDVVIKARHCR